MVRTLVLVDGEHYPPVVRAAVDELRASGREIVGAALLGGTEKLEADGQPDYGVPELFSGGPPLEVLDRALRSTGPQAVFDLCGSPVVDARSRMRLAAHALLAATRYEGADFRFDPPPRPRLAAQPSIAVVGTAKRSGKTAVAGHLARWLAAAGRDPLVVAMGRGGPEEPEVIDVGGDLSPAALLELAHQGRHAASDHLEDALMARVPTIGTRRTGGGLAGAPASATFARGVELANHRSEEFFVFEGSGSAIPPVHADATVCVVPATADPELVTGYLGPYVLLLADLVVVTLADEPLRVAADALEHRIRELVPGTPVVRTTFRPHPLESISGRSVFFATTANPGAARTLATHLAEAHGADVIGWSTNLANRRLLLEDLAAVADGAVEVLVTELKAAAVDVATKAALEMQMDVVYCDNRLVGTTDVAAPGEAPNGAPGDSVVDDALRALVARATERFSPPSPTGS